MKRVTIPDSSGALAAASAPTPLSATGPRDTASHRHPASPSLAPTRGLSSPFRCIGSQRPRPPNTGPRTLSARKPEAISPRSRSPPTLHPAHHTPGPGRAASRRRCGAAYTPNSLQPPRFFPSKASPRRGKGFPRRRAPDAARARHFRPNGRRGRRHGSRQARARILGRPSRRAGPRLTKYNGCQRH